MTFIGEGFAIGDKEMPAYLWERVQDCIGSRLTDPAHLREIRGLYTLVDEALTASDVLWEMMLGRDTGAVGIAVLTDAVEDAPERVAELFGYGWMPDAEYEACEQAEADAIVWEVARWGAWRTSTRGGSGVTSCSARGPGSSARRSRTTPHAGPMRAGWWAPRHT